MRLPAATSRSDGRLAGDGARKEQRNLERNILGVVEWCIVCQIVSWEEGGACGEGAMELQAWHLFAV